MQLLFSSTDYERRGRRLAKKKPRKNRTNETDLIHVFISSAQAEFQELRRDLKYDIEDEKIGRVHVFKVDLVEEKPGTNIEADIRTALEKCTIYVGIIGKQYSEATIKEFQSARSMGLPLLIYMFRKKPRSKPAAEKDKMWQILEEDIEIRGIRTIGNDMPYQDQNELLTYILADLGVHVAAMAIESARIRKILSC